MLLLRVMFGSVVLWQTRTMLLTLACVITENHVNFWSQYWWEWSMQLPETMSQSLVPLQEGTLLISMGHVLSGTIVIWLRLWQRVMLMSVVCIITRDHVEVHFSYWCLRTRGCPWFILLSKHSWQSMVCVPTDCTGQRRYFCSGINNRSFSWEKGT